MLIMDLVIKPYTSDMESIWDTFIDAAINGTFLQSRRFLSYHGEKFIDSSLMFYLKDKLICICPACTIIENEQKSFWAHKGSTFGGLIFAAGEYKAEKVIEIIKLLKQYLYENNYSEAYLKITADLFSLKSSDLLEYCLWYEGFNSYRELSTYSVLTDCTEDLAASFSRTYRRYRNRWMDVGAQFLELDSIDKISDFYDILVENLQIYNAKPIHSVDELIDLKFNRIPEETVFYGTYLDGKIVAGCLLFKFFPVKTIHMQYVATAQNLEYDLPSPTAFTYFSMLEVTRKLGFNRISWGTSNFEMGRVLNESLIRFKESLSDYHSQNKIYHWKRG